MKIALIGSGIAGLTCGWLLNRSGHAVTIFERQPVLGLDAHSIDLPIFDDGQIQRIDLPPRMFNRDEWPRLSALYQTLGVQTQDVNATKSFATARHDDLAGGLAPWLTLGDRYLDSLLPKFLLNRSARKVAAEIRRMRDAVSTESLSQMSEQLTFGDYLQTQKYDEVFVYDFLFPGLAGTVFTCGYPAIKNYPAKTVLSSLLNQFDRQPLQRTTFGTRDVAYRLTAEIDDIRLGCSVTAIQVQADGVSIVSQPSGDSEVFDHLVVATQANSAISLLGDEFESYKRLLAGFCYEDVPVVIHTDARFAPTNSRLEKCFNFVSNRQQTDAMCTISLEQFYPETEFERPLFQTIRPLMRPDPSQIVAEVVMQRPVVETTTESLIQQLQQLQQQPNTRVWFCGSYAAAGVPLLESGVASAEFLVCSLSRQTAGKNAIT